MMIITILPLEDHLPAIGGVSVLFMLFGALGTYVLLYRTRTMNKVWLHPVFVAAYGLILICSLIEIFHPDAAFKHLLQLSFMIAGGVFIATVCRDKATLRAALRGYMYGALWLAAIICVTMYDTLSSAVATGYHGASAVREAATQELSVEGNLNQLAFLVVQGSIVALAMSLSGGSVMRRVVALVATTFCLFAVCLTMSRGGIGIAILCWATVLYSHGGRRLRNWGILAGIAIGLLFVVPDVVFERFTYSGTDGRAGATRAAIETVSEYLVFGVGAGNFWNTWGVRKGFGGGKAVGAHNIFLQMTINWGIAALLVLLILIWRVFRCIPKGCGKDELALCLPAIALSLLLMMLFSHNFYDKWYSLGLGLLVGANYWVWPRGTIVADQRRE
jgi:hypothetical protein